MGRIRQQPCNPPEGLVLIIRAELMELYKDFCKNYPVITIEDPFDQDDWDNTTAFTAEGVSQV